MSYLHCPRCDRMAWLDAGVEPAPRCCHCNSALAPMPVRRALVLTGALRDRFERDMQGDARRPRFVRA
jgi:hypothetical protein